FIEEPAGLEPQHLAPLLRPHRVRQPQPLLGAGDPDVQQPALLVDAAFLDAGLVRQRAVLDADDEDVAELQALRRVQAHQPHLVAGLALVRVREQRELGREFAGTRSLAAVEPLGQLLQVLAAALERGLVAALGADRLQQPGAVGQLAHQARWRPALRLGTQAAYDAGQGIERDGGPPRQPLAARGGSCLSAPTDSIARAIGMLALRASSASRASVVAPTSRLGLVTARRKAASSSGLATSRSHASASLTSPRSRNAVPPVRW